MGQGGGLNVCDMIDGPVQWWEALVPFLVLALMAAAAGWLRGLKLWPLRAAGTVFLASILFVSLLLSTVTWRAGIMSDASCINTVDYRTTGAALFGLNVGVFLSARLARLRTRAWVSPHPGPKPEAGSREPSER